MNGPLLEMLAKAIGHHDQSCVDLLRDGAPIIGKLPKFEGGGAKLPDAKEPDLREFMVQAVSNNNEHVLHRLREDPHAAELHRACVEDAAKGRMTNPVLLKPEHCCSQVLSPRFAVEQGCRHLRSVSALVACLLSGLRDDGTIKIRPIDDLSASGVNAATFASEKLTNDGLDKLLEAMRRMKGSLLARQVALQCGALLAPLLSG